jgi:hypothetical protein
MHHATSKRQKSNEADALEGWDLPDALKAYSSPTKFVAIVINLKSLWVLASESYFWQVGCIKMSRSNSYPKLKCEL